MEKIYSKVDPEKLLHIIHRRTDFVDKKRNDVVDGDQFLQMASLNLSQGQTFKPHKHVFKETPLSNVIAQESWVVVRGSVRCIFYDINDSILAIRTIESGDCSITLEGGHNYESLEDMTWVLEFKTGPYLGQELDKEFI